MRNLGVERIINILMAYDTDKTYREIADYSGEGYNTVIAVLNRNGCYAEKNSIGRPRHPVGEPSKRDSEIISRYTSCETLAAIGDSYGISRERVRQILKKYGVTRKDGGITKRSRIEKEQRRSKIDNCFLPWYGCTRKESYSFPNGVRYAYANKKRNVANQHNEKLLLTLPEFWEVWDKSGLWSDHGRNRYNMTRKDFSKPWTKDNVQIVKFSESISLRNKHYDYYSNTD